MYSQFLGLRKNPFSQLNRQNSVYLPDSHQLILNQLTKCIENSTGIVGLTGPAGIGKSTLVLCLEAYLQDKEDIAYKDLSALVGTEIWSNSSQQAVNTVFEDNADGHRKSVFILEIANTIADVPLVKLLSIIAGRNTVNNPTLLILTGRNGLEKSLKKAQSELDAGLFQGIFHLDALNKDEVGNYINHRINDTQYSGPPLFTEDAILAAAALSKGIPGHINTVCGMALFQADQERLKVVTDKKIDEVSECCFLDNDSAYFSPQKNISKSDVSVPASIQATKQINEPLVNEPFTGNSSYGFSFKRLGTVLAIIIATTAITFQWYLAQQPADKPDILVQSETQKQKQLSEFSDATEDSTHSTAESTPENEQEHYALDTIASENNVDLQDELAESHIDVIHDLLAEARLQEQMYRLTLPQGNNAIATYQHILSLQPGNIEAIQGIERIQQKFIQRAKYAISQSQWNNAQTNLRKAKQINPDSQEVDVMLTEIQEAHRTHTTKVSINRAADSQEQAAERRASARYKLNESGFDFDMTNFFTLAERGNADLVALFLDANIPVDIQDSALGDTALIKAASYGHLDTVKLILNRQANIDKQNRIGRTALMSAIVLEQYAIAIDLLNYNTANINISDKNGWNALMFAVEKNQPSIVKALVRKGADIHARNTLGQSALSIAQKNDNHAIMAILQSTH